MQVVSQTWHPPTGPLGELTEAAYRRAAALRPRLQEIERRAAGAPSPPRFADALQRSAVAVIAEVKRRSPSKGVLNAGLDAGSRAADYVAGGAAALSVLTEPDRFGGALDDLIAVRSTVAVPLLRKDFLVDEGQLLEARMAGAAAVLLIARALPPARLRALAAFARTLGLEPLVEVRTMAELDGALHADARLIGVNNRDLETLVIDPATGAALLPRIPADRVAVYESGVTTADDVRRAAEAGADAVLVGSVLSTAPDGEEAVRALAAVPRHAGGRGRG